MFWDFAGKGKLQYQHIPDVFGVWPGQMADFLALTGPAACIEATALFASGDTATAEWGNCSPASGAVVTRGNWDEVTLKESDRIELLVFAAGG